MSIIDQLNKLVDEIEFSDQVKDKVKKLSVKAKLKQKTGIKEEECLTLEEIEELAQLIKADIALDAVEIEGNKIYLAEIDKILAGLKK